MSTSFHSKYFAFELSRVGGEGLDRLGRALFDASVDLNPHQIEAALFALRSPLSKGVLLADEVGLGKTIEAGLVLCQRWAEKRRRLLVICPASLRKQWALELAEKFNLPSIIIEGKSYRDLSRTGHQMPFMQPAVVICSMHFAASRESDVKMVPWDLVVVDEAHKLRNAYRESNVAGQAIRRATEGRFKILLTATPLQNSLMELYGLATLIDPELFGDAPTFRTRFVNQGGDLQALKGRLQPFYRRTLRSQVLPYVRYTKRELLTFPFEPTEQEHGLYEAVSRFLQDEGEYALPQRQRHLLVMLVRKVLASSPHAVSGTLTMIRDRLQRVYNLALKNAGVVEQLLLDEELEDETLQELLEDIEDNLDEQTDDVGAPSNEPAKIDLAKMKQEIATLEGFIASAHGIGVDTKAKALKTALEVGFAKMVELGGQRKAVIFTESRRTQHYLRGYLEANGYAGQVVTFNGTNKEAESDQIYRHWLEKNKDGGRATGSRPVDCRTALLDAFKDDASILIATEAASEGLNLQFCSFVVNFDLPWNPQRIEQRIGRCHRYGQLCDVVVVNFINQRNAADIRVHELLDQKFHLFSGLFGASDEVLGSIEMGMDFAQKVLEICQRCRTPQQIEAAFDALQLELDASIKQSLKETRELLDQNFDEDVQERLRLGAHERLDKISRMVWSMTKYELSEQGRFDDVQLSFDLLHAVGESRPGRYHLIRKGNKQAQVSLDLGDFLYRLSHPLGEAVLKQASERVLGLEAVRFDISGHIGKISVVEEIKGKSGWLRLQRLRVKSFDQEEYLLFSGFDDQGRSVDPETLEKLFQCEGQVLGPVQEVPLATSLLGPSCQRRVEATLVGNLESNNTHYQEVAQQLDAWADDQEKSAQRALENTKAQIRELQRQARLAGTLDEQRALQERIADLEKQKRKQRQEIFQVDDDTEARRANVLAELQSKLAQKVEVEDLFTLNWSVI